MKKTFRNLCLLFSNLMQIYQSGKNHNNSYVPENFIQIMSGWIEKRAKWVLPRRKRASAWTEPHLLCVTSQYPHSNLPTKWLVSTCTSQLWSLYLQLFLLSGWSGDMRMNQERAEPWEAREEPLRWVGSQGLVCKSTKIWHSQFCSSGTELTVVLEVFPAA